MNFGSASGNDFTSGDGSAFGEGSAFGSNSPTPSGRKRLARSEDRWLGGVAGGVADYFGVDPMVIRALFIASCLLPGPQVLLYVILWFVMPDNRS